jgi:hypothetical protein
MQVKLDRAPLLRSKVRSRIEELNHAARPTLPRPNRASNAPQRATTRIASSFWNAQAAEPNIKYHSSGINTVNSKPIVASRNYPDIFEDVGCFTTSDQVDCRLRTEAAGD